MEKYHCLADLLFILFGFSCFAYVEWTTVLLVWSNSNQTNRRSAVQWSFPLYWIRYNLPDCAWCQWGCSDWDEATWRSERASPPGSGWCSSPHQSAEQKGRRLYWVLKYCIRYFFQQQNTSTFILVVLISKA